MNNTKKELEQYAIDNIRKQLDQYLEEALFYYDLPGLTVAVFLGEKINYKNAAGYKNFITKEPLSASDYFHMGSVSKLFTASAIMNLCREGTLRLDDHLAELLPFVKIEDKRYKDIKLHHMLSHTSGLGDVSDYQWNRPRLDEGALKDYALSDEVIKSPLLWSPEENKFRYSNMAYELLGLIVAESSGLSYEAYIKKYFLDPLHMNDATFLTYERAGGSLALEDLSKAGMALPHKKDETKHIVLEQHMPYNRRHAPSSTLTSNVEDLCKWGEAHLLGEARLTGSLFPPDYYEQSWKPRAIVPNNGEGMGLGWFIREQAGYTLYGHEGTDDGYRASFWICPKLHLQIIVASNLSKAPVKRINKKLFEIITG